MPWWGCLTRRGSQAQTSAIHPTRGRMPAMSKEVKIFSEDERRKLYGAATLSDRLPGRVNKGTHTMGHAELLKYIGLQDYQGVLDAAFSLKTKKFSQSQSGLIKEAAEKKLPIQVIGAYRTDIHYIAERNGREIVTGTISENARPIPFNNLRPVMFFVNDITSGRPGKQELWVVVFPSRQYVEQYAELLLAILTELDKPKEIGNSDAARDARQQLIEETVRNRISVTHFQNLASNIGNWTNLLPFAAQHLRLGEIVTIGNIDIFESGLKTFSFESETETWMRGGLDNIFGLKILVNRINKARIALLGIAECFWGDASSQYVDTLLYAGARHILYGSKAATLVDKKLIGEVIAPNTFVTVRRGLGPRGELPDENELTDEIVVPNLLKTMAAAFDIKYSGLGVTVPTVMGEDHEEYKTFNVLRPACMDCENGHIASVINQYNKRDGRLPRMLHSGRTRGAKFVPLHFVTDYIYSHNEVPGEGVPNLTTDSRDEPHLMRKLRGYAKIGQYFGAYANVFWAPPRLRGSAKR